MISDIPLDPQALDVASFFVYYVCVVPDLCTHIHKIQVAATLRNPYGWMHSCYGKWN